MLVMCEYCNICSVTARKGRRSLETDCASTRGAFVPFVSHEYVVAAMLMLEQCL